MDQKIIDLYDEYTHAPLPRRVFLERLAILVGSAAAVEATLRLLEPGYAQAQTVAETDPRISAERVTIGGEVPLKAYVARPKTPGRRGAVIVVHENRGLNAHIEDVTRRVAAAGFVALAPDYLSVNGGTPGDAEAARQMFTSLKPEAVIGMTQQAMGALKADPAVNGKIGIMGFCWGGGVVNRAAVAIPELSAGVVFYGVAPDLAGVAAIRMPLLIHLASLDQRVNDTYPKYEEALKAAGKRYTVHMYPNVNHAFHNDTSGERYNEAAAKLAFERTVAFFQAELG
jgi:carboxymethylenebutenolidase